MSAVFRHSVDRLRADLVENRHGNEVRDWVSPATETLTGWAVDAGDSRALNTRQADAGRDGSEVRYTIRKIGLDVDVLGSDRIRLFGEVFEVEGGVLRQPGPSSRTSHTIVALARVTG